MRVFGGIALLMAAFWLTLPPAAEAQMEFSLDEVEEEEAKPAEKQTSEGDLIEELAASDDTASDGPAEPEPQREEIAEEIYAVQQIYALRLKRVELAPSAAFTLNDPYLKRYGLGFAMNYWFTNVLALGVNFIWYDWGTDPLSRGTDLVPRIQNQFRLGVPINDWQFGLWANFTYVPFYGKFKVRKKIFQWDAYLIGGVGLMRTQPIPVFDPERRSFDWQNNVAFNVGAGLRIFLTRYLTFFAEFRAYMWPDKFENLRVDPAVPEDSSTWLESGSTFVANTSIQIGFTLFLPIKFEYRLPK
ncbi:MAG: outer membrane beta-barrel domain-containing protein [Deltaproteobacteria bacterium]|nr:outer membrane beta-barrel domain-containing protein [Deltaproteobacteria bacterium]